MAISAHLSLSKLQLQWFLQLVVVVVAWLLLLQLFLWLVSLVHLQLLSFLLSQQQNILVVTTTIMRDTAIMVMMAPAAIGFYSYR